MRLKKKIYSREDLFNFINSVADRDLPVEITVESESKKRRSLSQNALLWKWNKQVSDWLKQKGGQYQGWTPGHVHDMHKHTFLGWRIGKYTNIKSGVRLEKQVLRSTATLCKEDMKEFMDKVYYFWADKKLFLFVPELSDYFNSRGGHI